MQTAEIGVSTQKRTQFVDITARVVSLVKKQDWRNGVLTIFSPHTTAGITINENADPDVIRDMAWFSDQLIPCSPEFRHSEGNSDAHLKASFFGPSLQVIVREGRLWLGTWQALYFCEFDGPRQRRVFVAFSGDQAVYTVDSSPYRDSA
ncbi:MAG: YjbQ family protein [Desulfuromonadales bacterium]|nr:YjbQ family protein [Desulfuromonadales bacterium]